MLKKLLITSAIAGTAIFMLNSFSAGPASIPSAGNRTGSGPGTANCSGGFCHGPNTASTGIFLLVLDSNVPVTTYVPGQTYKVRLTGGSAGNLPKFGFQLAAVKELSITTQAGTFDVSMLTNVHVKDTLGVSVVEHTAPLNGVAVGNAWAYTVNDFDWTAPAAGTGNVKFFTTLLSSNGNGAASGDSANNATIVLTESPVSVKAINSVSAISAYPNPAMGDMSLSATAATAGSYTLTAYDMTGKKMYSTTVKHNGGSFSIAVPSANWAAGQYILQVASQAGTSVVPVVKL